MPTSKLNDALAKRLETLGQENGGYVVTRHTIIWYLRKTSPFYVYSNPVTPAEAAAAGVAVDALDSPTGIALVEKSGWDGGPLPVRAGEPRFRNVAWGGTSTRRSMFFGRCRPKVSGAV
jgi:hypothetical protein